MTTKPSPRDFTCPDCHADPGKPCHSARGKTQQTFHTRRLYKAQDARAAQLEQGVMRRARSTRPTTRKPARQLEAEIATSLAQRARAKGFEPETEEGGRAMMQSLTLADIAKLENRPPYLAPGTPVEVHFHQVGGTTKLAGIVKWDYRKDVDVKLAAGYGGRVVRATRSSSGQLNIYHL